jgi:hypothetical protein
MVLLILLWYATLPPYLQEIREKNKKDIQKESVLILPWYAPLSCSPLLLFSPPLLFSSLLSSFPLVGNREYKKKVTLNS